MGILESIIALDERAFAWVNGHGLSYLDGLLLFVSSPWAALIVVVLAFRSVWKAWSWAAAIRLVSFSMLVFILADALSVYAFKEVFERLRPCHTPHLLPQLRLVAKSCGGSYGFVSSHATNTAAFAAVLVAARAPRYAQGIAIVFVLLTLWSRVHLGVHYTGGVLCGALVGMILGRTLTQWVLAQGWIDQEKATKPGGIRSAQDKTVKNE